MPFFKRQRTVSLQLYVATTLFLGFWAATATFSHLKHSIPPFVFFDDRGGATFTTRSPQALHATAALFTELGDTARYDLSSGGILRAAFDDNTIINHTDPEIWTKMGSPAASKSIVVDDPPAKAREAVAMMKLRGFECTIMAPFDKDLAPDLLMGVTCPTAWPEWFLVLRRDRMTLGGWKQPKAWVPLSS